MKKVFKLQKKFHDALLKDPEFEYDLSRPYHVIKNLDYKGAKVNVGIPLRSNINKDFSSKTDEYVATVPSDHTLIGKGNIAGWHITKMIPISFDKTVTHNVASDSSLIIPFEIANNLCNADLVEKTKKMLARIESGEKVFGALILIVH